MSTLAAQFTEVFRAEHRDVRDRLLELVGAFQQRNLARARALLGEVAQLTGPHFRYEEESLYPALVGIFGADYVEKLLADHDQAIANAARLLELAESESLTEEEVDEAVRLVRAILPHVSDCDGLSIMVEVIPEEQVSPIFAARELARAEGLDLLAWSADVRERRLA